MKEVRLIDANVFIEDLTAVEAVYGVISVGAMIRALKKAETIDPESLRPHGQWVWDEENECWVCSNCELSALNNYRGNSTDSNYCPNCGAKMDLED